MTLMTDPTTTARPSRTNAPMSAGHPALGRAPEAEIVPGGLDCYQILLDDAVVGRRVAARRRRDLRRRRHDVADGQAGRRATIARQS